MLSIAVWCFQILNVVATIVSITYDIWRHYARPDEWKRLTIAKWVYYFCAFSSFFLSKGLIATWGDNATRSNDDIAICILFGLACIICISCMIIQKNWSICYNEHVLIVRNGWRSTREYSLNTLVLKTACGGRITQLFCEEKKIAQWDIFLVNIKGDIELWKCISKIRDNAMT